ncbi:hypothetical protein B0J11DRAFT_437495, partial [Dendryphion nanum]
MTTIIGDCHAWGWWPDPDLTTDIVNTAYDNLPSDSTFTRYLVSSWAYLFAPSKRTASTEQVHRGLHPDFLYDMVIFQTRRLKGEMAQFGEAHADSCCFHEHSIFNHDECRQRLKNNTYIFAALIDACMAEPELDLLCTVAPYFRGAFQGGVKEAEEKSISLHDVSEQTFRAFPQWAYAQITIQG